MGPKRPKPGARERTCRSLYGQCTVREGFRPMIEGRSPSTRHRGRFGLSVQDKQRPTTGKWIVTGPPISPMGSEGPRVHNAGLTFPDSQGSKRPLVDGA